MRRIICILLIAFIFPVLASAEEGLASWYGGKFQGRQTASGEVFDTNLLTAAHKELAFGTIVRVTNLRNDQAVTVRINDRGPFVRGRIIDLSRAAAEAVDLVSMGVAPVKVEVLESPPRNLNLYGIQIGAYRQEENAVRAKDRIEQEGFTVALLETEDGIYRVTIPDVQESDIDPLRNILQEAGFPHCLVRRQTPAGHVAGGTASSASPQPDVVIED